MIRARRATSKGWLRSSTIRTRCGDRDLPTLDPRKVIDGYDITVSGQQTKLRRVGLDWKLFGGPGEAKAWKAFVDQLEGVVTAKRAIKEFTTPKPEDFNTVSATLSYGPMASRPTTPNAEPARSRRRPSRRRLIRPQGRRRDPRSPRTLPNGQPKHVYSARDAASRNRPGRRAGGCFPRRDWICWTVRCRSFSDTPKISVTGAEANYTLAHKTRS